MALDLKGMAEDLLLRDVVLSYPKLDKPHKYNNDQKPKFEATFLMDPESETAKELQAAIDAVYKKLSEALGSTVEVRHPIIKKKEGEKLKKNPEYAGKVFARATSGEEYQPKVVDRDPKVAFDPAKVQGGHVVNARVVVAPYDSNGARGVTLYLQAVQVVNTENTFGNSVDAASCFDTLDAPEPNDTGFDAL